MLVVCCLWFVVLLMQHVYISRTARISGNHKQQTSNHKQQTVIVVAESFPYTVYKSSHHSFAARLCWAEQLK